MSFVNLTQTNGRTVLVNSSSISRIVDLEDFRRIVFKTSSEDSYIDVKEGIYLIETGLSKRRER